MPTGKKIDPVAASFANSNVLPPSSLNQAMALLVTLPCAPTPFQIMRLGWYLFALESCKASPRPTTILWTPRGSTSLRLRGSTHVSPLLATPPQHHKG